jgi:hypothetical protein
MHAYMNDCLAAEFHTFGSGLVAEGTSAAHSEDFGISRNLPLGDAR